MNRAELRAAERAERQRVNAERRAALDGGGRGSAESGGQSGGQLASAPLPPDDSPAPASTEDLYATMLRGAHTAMQRLHAGMEQNLEPRELKELSVTANVLMRAARFLESKEKEPTTPDAVARAADEVERVRAELARRRG